MRELNNRNFFHFTTALAVLCLLLGAGCGGGPEPASDEEVRFDAATNLFSPTDGRPAAGQEVIAVVEGRPISRQDVQRETQLLMASLRNRMRPEDMQQALPQIANEAFGNLVKQALLLDAIEDRDIQVDDETLQERLQQMKDSLPEGEAWEGFLERVGLTEPQVLHRLRTTQQIEKLLTEQVGEIEPVGPEQIQSFYEANTNMFHRPDLAGFSHILLRVPPDADQDQVEKIRTRAEQIRDLAGDEMEFEPLAAAHSEDEMSRTRGGYVGKVTSNQVPPELAEALFSAEEGHVGDVVRTPAGFHIVRIESREPARQMTLEEVSGTVSNLLVQQRRSEKVNAYLEELRQAAEIETMGPEPEPEAQPQPEEQPEP